MTDIVGYLHAQSMLMAFITATVVAHSGQLGQQAALWYAL